MVLPFHLLIECTAHPTKGLINTEFHFYPLLANIYICSKQAGVLHLLHHPRAIHLDEEHLVVRPL